MNQIFDGLRVVLTLSFLFYASWSDYKTREVSNRVWAILAPSSFALTTFQFFVFAPESLQIYVLSFAITSALALVLFYAGAFGGADGKALISLSLALPIYPAFLFRQPQSFVSPLFPITVFTNSVLLAALSVFYALSRNLLWKIRNEKGFFEELNEEPVGRKILTLICGYKAKISKLVEGGHLYPLEDVLVSETGEITRKLLSLPKDEERGEILARILAAAEGKHENEIWVTPGLPMLIFITAGLIIALAYGDILWTVFQLVF